jgi:hypothetical protein
MGGIPQIESLNPELEDQTFADWGVLEERDIDAL